MEEEGMKEVGHTEESHGQESSDGEIQDMATSAEGSGGVVRVHRLRIPSSLVSGEDWTVRSWT
jgi:hypothetical protein